ncbi:hypothetical protein [Agaribacter flavus]|uniref:Uncharacterized protein n=1 Tax=Agaribacter flavus TaxID=1902781 RepID=A0ABV7FIB1_9ALTE
MAFIKVKLNSQSYKNFKIEYLLESDLNLEFKVLCSNENTSMYEIYEKGELLAVVGVAGYFWHRDHMIKKSDSYGWEGLPIGDLKLTTDNQVLINGTAKANLASFGIFEWLKEVLVNLRLVKFEQWLLINFNENEMSQDIAICALFLRFAAKFSD